MPKKDQLNILVTAGPTHEYIDPVRYITNLSTGAMGYAIAMAAKQRGHNVTLISGPVSIPARPGIKPISVVSGWQMKKTVEEYFPDCDCLVMAAAVADFRPRFIAPQKIKKAKSMLLELEENPDILKGLANKKGRRVLVGFALETRDLIKNAKIKLKQKNLDMIIANQCTKNNQPFGDKKLSLCIIDKEDKEEGFIDITKPKLAGIILDRIEKLWYSQKSNVNRKQCLKT